MPGAAVDSNSSITGNSRPEACRWVSSPASTAHNSKRSNAPCAKALITPSSS